MQIGVVEITAEGRNRLVSRVESWLGSGAKDYSLLPRLSIKPVSPDEIRFQSCLDLCFVGPELLAADLKQITPLRHAIPDATLIAVVDRRTESLTVAEELARLGVDDVMNGASDSFDVARRVVLLTMRRAKNKTGKTILVDSWKGGVGVTSVAAGLAEGLIDKGKRVCLVDWDQDTQDLSRYLFVRPFLSEDLALLLAQQRAVTAETVRHCLLPVWSGEEQLKLLTPAALSIDQESASRSSSMQNIYRVWLSIKDALETLFDFVVIDASGASMQVRRSFYPVVDSVAYVVSPDIGGVQAAAQAMSVISSLRGRSERLVVVSNNTKAGDLSASRLAHDAMQAIGINSATIAEVGVQYSRDIESWPGSGKTPYSVNRSARSAFASAAAAFVGTISFDAEKIGHTESTKPALNFGQARIKGLLSSLFSKSKSRDKVSAPSPIVQKKEVIQQLPEPVNTSNGNGAMSTFVSHATLSNE